MTDLLYILEIAVSTVSADRFACHILRSYRPVRIAVCVYVSSARCSDKLHYSTVLVLAS